jgi:nuclear transport factor 2 (NTF2) superfamily protein
MTRSPLPPFDPASAAAKVRAAEDAWNSRDPRKVAAAYTPDTVWRNRSEFLNGRAEVEAFLTRKWEAERDYRLIKELWAFDGPRIAVRFAYEARDSQGIWFRAYGNENWEFASDGRMAVRRASINDLLITESDRLFHWPLGPRPEDHPGLSQLGL